MIRKRLLLLLLVLAVPVHAERVWVVGSYAQKENALRSMERLSMMLGVEVMVIPYVKGGTHRVVIRETAIGSGELAENGVEGWLANLDIRAVQSEAPQVSIPKAPSSPVVIASEVEKLTANPDESIDEFCERDPGLCDPDALVRIRERRQLLANKRSELSADCDAVSSVAEREICEAWRSGQNLDTIADQ